MKRDKKLTPEEVQNHPNKLLEFHYFDKEYNCDWYYYWLKDGEFLTWATRSIRHKEQKIYSMTKLEIPIKGLHWFVDTIEQKFFKTAAKGGLEAGKFGFAEVLDGEKLSVSRMFGVPGYDFMNFARENYDPYDSGPQYAEFSDEWLFDLGLFEQFKDLAHKIEGGQV